MHLAIICHPNIISYSPPNDPLTDDTKGIILQSTSGSSVTWFKIEFNDDHFEVSYRLRLNADDCIIIFNVSAYVYKTQTIWNALKLFYKNPTFLRYADEEANSKIRIQCRPGETFYPVAYGKPNGTPSISFKRHAHDKAFPCSTRVNVRKKPKKQS